MRVLFNFEPEPVPGLGAPTVFDVTKTDEQRKVLTFFAGNVLLGRPILAPPGVPAERVAVLRRAFEATMHDPALLAEAKSMSFEITSAQRRAGSPRSWPTSPPPRPIRSRAPSARPDTNRLQAATIGATPREKQVRSGRAPCQSRPCRTPNRPSMSRTSNISATVTSRSARGCSRRTAPVRSRPSSSCTAECGPRTTAPAARPTTRRSRATASRSRRSTSARARAAIRTRCIDINYAIRWVKAQRCPPQVPSRPRRHRGQLERRPSGDAGGDAAARSALFLDRTAGGLARGRRHGALRRDVLAGDQPARPPRTTHVACAMAPIRRTGRRAP